MNAILEAIVGTMQMLYYILEAIVLLFVPVQFRYKDVKGQTVLITGAGTYCRLFSDMYFSFHINSQMI